MTRDKEEEKKRKMKMNIFFPSERSRRQPYIYIYIDTHQSVFVQWHEARFDFFFRSQNIIILRVIPL
jgi:hypothetical protein